MLITRINYSALPHPSKPYLTCTMYTLTARCTSVLTRKVYHLTCTECNVIYLHRETSLCLRAYKVSTYLQYF